MKRKQSQRGIALISALIVVALATTAATGLILSQQLGMRRAENMFSRDQALQYLQGAEIWASEVLLNDQKQNKTDTLEEPWAQSLPPLPVEGGTVQGTLTDLNRFIDLNAILSADGKIASLPLQRLQGLLTALELPRELADTMVDWVDADNDPFSGNGAEDSYYTGLPKPYRSANTRMQSSSELLQLKDVTEKVFKALAPHITALPETSMININTAPKEVLMALGLSASVADAVIAERPYEAVENFVNLQPVQAAEVVGEGLSVASNYFLLTTTARIGRSSMTQYSVLKRDNGKVSVARRSLGTQ